MPIESVTYTTKPSRDSNGPYITVYAPDGSYVSRHVNMEECTESALAHAEAEGIEGVYRFVPPEKHMAVRRRTVILPSGTTITESAQPGAGSIPVSGGQPSLSFETPGNLDVPGTFFLDSSAPGGGDGTSPATAWNSVAQARARTWQTNDRLYFERSGYYDFGGSTLNLWEGATIGGYYIDGGIPVSLDEGSDPSTRPETTSNAPGPNNAGLPHFDNVPNAHVLGVPSVNNVTIENICIDGDLDTADEKGFNTTGLVSEPTSSVRQHILVSGTSQNCTIQKSHFEDARGWFGIQFQDSSSGSILNCTGGDHGFWYGDPAIPQQDNGNFIELKTSGAMLVQGNHFRGGGHDVINVETCDAIIRFNTFDGEVGPVGSGIGNKAVELRTNCSSSTIDMYANVIRNNLPTIDDEEGATKSRGDDILWRFNRHEYMAAHSITVSGSTQHRTSNDQVFYNNEFTNFGFGDDFFNGEEFFGATLILSGGSPDPFYASRGYFVNNAIDANQSTNPRFMQWDNNMDTDPGASNLWNDWFVGYNRFVDANPEVRRQGIGSVSIVTRESEYPDNFSNNDVGVTGLSADTGGTHVATITGPPGSGTSFTVDRPQAFRDGGSLAGGDEIYVNGNTVSITDITGSTITVDGFVSWAQGDGVSLAVMMNGSDVRQGIPPSVTPGHPTSSSVGTLAPIITESHWVLGGPVNNNDVTWLNGISTANLEPFDCVVKRYYWGQHESAGSGTISGSFDFTDMDAMVAAVAARGKYFQVVLQWKHSNASIGDIVPSDLTAFQFSVDGGQCAMMYDNTVRTRFQQWCIAVIDRYAGNETFAGIQTNETSGMGNGAGYVQADYITQIRSLYINLLNRNSSKYVGIGWNFIPGANNLADAQTALTTLFGGVAFETRPNLYFWTPDIVRDDPDSDNSFTALNDRTYQLFDPAYSGVTFTPINRHPCGSSMQFASYTLPDSATATNSDTVNNGGYDSDELFTWARTNLRIPFCTWTYQNDRDYTFDSPTSGNTYGDAVGVARLAWDHSYTSSYASSPYTPQGTIPSGWDSLINWPDAPVITSGPTNVTPATLSANLVTGAHLILTDDPGYGSLEITSSVTDVILEAENPGGAVFSFLGVHTNRVKIVGLRVNGQIRLADQLGPATGFPTNVLFDNVHATLTSDTTPTVLYGEGATQIAFINSTIIANGDNYPILYTGTGVSSEDFILANCYTNSTNGSANADAFRIGHTSRIILLDNWIESEPTTFNQTRMHAEIEDILLSNNIFIDGATKLFIDQNSSGPAGIYARRLFVIDCEMYDQTVHVGSDGPFTAVSTDGAVSDAEATGNRHYSGAQASGSSVMNQGATAWVTYSDNLRLPYQAPPTRTQGASH